MYRRAIRICRKPDMKHLLKPADYEALAGFRYAMRKFLRFSKEALMQHGQITPEQYEIMIALRALGTGTGVSIIELSERLQVKHHTAVGLVAKLAQKGIVNTETDPEDRRKVRVTLTPEGNSLIERLAPMHLTYFRENAAEMIAALQRLQNDADVSQG